MIPKETKVNLYYKEVFCERQLSTLKIVSQNKMPIESLAVFFFFIFIFLFILQLFQGPSNEALTLTRL